MPRTLQIDAFTGSANTDSCALQFNQPEHFDHASQEYIVELDASERERLTTLISKGKAAAKSILKARILLKADQGESGPAWPDAQVVEALETSLSMVMRVREKLVTEGARCGVCPQEACNTADFRR